MTRKPDDVVEPIWEEVRSGPRWVMSTAFFDIPGEEPSQAEDEEDK